MEDLARAAIERARDLGAEFADLRIESTIGTNIDLMDGRTKSVSALRESGCGLRAFIGGAWGFAATSVLTKASLAAAVASAVKMAKVAKARAKLEFHILPSRAVRARDEYPCKEKPSDVRVEEKLEFVRGLEKSMRALDARIGSTNVRYGDLEAERVVANSFGTIVVSRERWVVGSCSAWAKSDGVTQRGHASVGSVGGYELMRTDRASGIGERSAAQAIRLLDSKPVPAGKFTVILDNEMTGILAHEAFGHACEADAVLAGSSVLEGRLGQRVAKEEVSLIDDPTIRGSFGYFAYDWEGVKARRHVLIDEGVLKSFLHSIETGSRMKAEPNGAARSQAYGSPPVVRMSNTFIAGGDLKKDELFEDIKAGLLLVGAQYGYVEPSKGQFMFKCDEAYEIARGEVGQRYRDASISGVILEVLSNVEGLANDFKLGDPGYCGKAGQTARTNEGGPHMRVAHMVVGGLA